MTLLNYRSSFENREILRILQKSTTMADNFVWQSHHMGKNIINVQHLEIDFVSREVVLAYDSTRFKLDLDLPLYVKLNHRGSIFKVTKFHLKARAIHFALPVEIQTEELRGDKRFAFRPDILKSVGLKPYSPTNVMSLHESGSTLTVKVFDVSSSGLGLILSEANRTFIKNNRILWVTNFQGEDLQYPILAEVMYLNNEIDPQYQVRKQKELKLGLKLSGVIPSNVLHKFMQ